MALGGLPIGLLAFGGCAAAWQAAVGGVAIAHDIALDGLALAENANNEGAKQFMAGHDFVYDIDFSPDRTALAISLTTQRPDIQFFNTANWQATAAVPNGESPEAIMQLLYSPGGEYLAATLRGGR
ncbi:MAG: hypothetical protein GXY83_14930 [Rhodopirellula sp.]|nr:hypothetical protein [Rhodopirellula sp.]